MYPIMYHQVSPNVSNSVLKIKKDWWYNSSSTIHNKNTLGFYWQFFLEFLLSPGGCVQRLQPGCWPLPHQMYLHLFVLTHIHFSHTCLSRLAWLLILFLLCLKLGGKKIMNKLIGLRRNLIKSQSEISTV